MERLATPTLDMLAARQRKAVKASARGGARRNAAGELVSKSAPADVSVAKNGSTAAVAQRLSVARARTAAAAAGGGSSSVPNLPPLTALSRAASRGRARARSKTATGTGRSSVRRKSLRSSGGGSARPGTGASDAETESVATTGRSMSTFYSSWHPDTPSSSQPYGSSRSHQRMVLTPSLVPTDTHGKPQTSKSLQSVLQRDAARLLRPRTASDQEYMQRLLVTVAQGVQSNTDAKVEFLEKQIAELKNVLVKQLGEGDPAAAAAAAIAAGALNTKASAPVNTGDVGLGLVRMAHSASTPIMMQQQQQQQQQQRRGQGTGKSGAPHKRRVKLGAIKARVHVPNVRRGREVYGKPPPAISSLPSHAHDASKARVVL